MNFVIYSVCYDKTEPGEGVRVYNIKKVAEFAEWLDGKGRKLEGTGGRARTRGKELRHLCDKVKNKTPRQVRGK